MQHSTIAAIATAPGAGGIAIVRLSGPESYEVAAKVFRPANPAKKVADAKGYTAMFGAFVEGEEAFDEGVALFFRAPHSYTGEDVVELSCHGGSAVARRLVEACIAAGASPAAPGEYTRRAFLNDKLSLTQAEAVMDIISADGRQGAALANASLNGALARKIAAQKDALTALQAHLAAWVDFPEEDVPELSQSHLCDVLGGVEQELDALIQSYDAGAVLREGVDCAIVGKPNAGKSTLLNLLAGFDRAIVTPVAGTTRDVVEQAVKAVRFQHLARQIRIDVLRIVRGLQDQRLVVHVAHAREAVDLHAVLQRHQTLDLRRGVDDIKAHQCGRGVLAHRRDLRRERILHALAPRARIGDEGALAALAHDEAGLLQRADGLPHGVAADLEFIAKLRLARQQIAHPQRTGRDGVLDDAGQLRVQRNIARHRE